MVVCSDSSGGNTGGGGGDIGIGRGGLLGDAATSSLSSSSSSSCDESTPQLFCLRWNNYQTNLTNVFDQLLQNESFVDVTLACADGHSVKAHKMVLSACSPYFQSLFYDNPCKHPIVIMKDIKWNELKAAVEFMYRGEINICQEQIGPLLKVAESLKIRGLADVNNEHELAAAATAAATPAERQSPATLASVAVSAALAAAAVTDRSAATMRRANLSNMISSAANRKRRRVTLESNGCAAISADDTVSVIHSPILTADLISPSPTADGCAAADDEDDTLCNPMSSSNVLGTATAATCCSSSASSLLASCVQGQSLFSRYAPTSQTSPTRSPPPVNTSVTVSQQQQQLQQQQQQQQQQQRLQPHTSSLSSLTVPNTSGGCAIIDEMEIKPGIAEMIREEERVSVSSRLRYS